MGTVLNLIMLVGNEPTYQCDQKGRFIGLWATLLVLSIGT